LTKDLGKTEEEEEDLESTQVARGRLARFEMVAIFFRRGKYESVFSWFDRSEDKNKERGLKMGLVKF